MTLNIPDAPSRRTFSVWLAAVTAVVMAAAVLAMSPTRAQAVADPVDLGTAADYGVLAGSTVTNTGPTVVNGLNVGVSPGSAITGFFPPTPPPSGIVTPPGAQHAGDAEAAQAKADLTTAYNSAAGQPDPDAVYGANHDFGGQVLLKGLYKTTSSAQITTGPLTLDAEGDPSAVWVFQIGSTLTTASASSVSFINGASPCNVYWQVGSSATLGTNSTFVGTILAHTSITATTGANINGRLLAGAGPSGNGAVTLDTNTIGLSGCGSATTGETTGTTPGETTGTTPGETTGTTPGETTGTTPGETTGTTP
ncbi:ice-binding family protein, partial [Streptomyces sp. NPDC051956]|uniref:ice-binding family protein n=1 Tax=Streptomyces sp. NPDC051956 TaxID=3365677 RepID=UPI0037D4CA5B